MPADPPGIEPVVSQIPTDELKRILTDRFAHQVGAEAGKRLWRPITLFGLPGIVLASTLVWQLLDTAISNKISAQFRDGQRAMETSLGSTMNTLFTARSEVARLEARAAINDAFQAQQGAALGEVLQRATREERFQQDLTAIVTAALAGSWARESPRLRENFLQELSRDESFREAFARDVEQAMGRAQSVPRIIAGALEASLLRRRTEDGGQAVPLALLASMDQGKANDVVRALLERSRTDGHGEVALGALAAVSFAGLPSDRAAPSGMLTSALDVWSEYCADARCAPDQAVSTSMAAFLRRGRELEGTDRDAWVTALQLWHENLVATPEARARESSLGLVPHALGEIGSPEAIRVLTRWAVSTDAELALSTTQAIGTLPPDALPDRERLSLIRSLWGRVTENEGERVALTEAAWMALGEISRGVADPNAGPFTAEAVLVRAMLAGQERRGDLAVWANAPQFEVLVRRGSAVRPPRSPCAIGGSFATGIEEVVERPGRLRADLCALAALLRPKAGATEWTLLRPPLVQRDRVALLGLLWAIAADGVSDAAGMGLDERFAPLHDLLLSAYPPPPGLHLAGMLVLRTASDRQAWQALEAMETMRDVVGEPTNFLAASRWLYRAGSEEAAWFADKLRGWPPERRAAVVETILRSVLAQPQSGETGASGPALPRLSAAMRRGATTGMVNGLTLLYGIEPEVVQTAAERDGLLATLRDLSEGRSRAPVARGTALRLQEALLGATGWSDASAALAPQRVTQALPVPLVPAFRGRFGRFRLEDGALVRLEGPAGGPSVALFHMATHRSLVLAPGANWQVRGGGEAPDGWLFRLDGEAPGMQLAGVLPTTVEPSADAAAARPMERGVVYRIASLSSEGDSWLRIEGVTRGEKLRIATFGLAREVDTVVALVRDGAVLAEDDDGGEGFESLLSWTADRAGPVMLRLRNIGTTGGFNVMVTRED